MSYPAAFDDACIAVAATDQSNRRANFSNRGSQLDLSAPGVGIESTYLANTYRELNGTSMATPHVAGVAAILLSRYPGLSPLMAQRHLEATAMPLGASDLYGRGLVHAEQAVATQPQPVVSPAVAVVGRATIHMVSMTAPLSTSVAISLLLIAHCSLLIAH